MSGPGEPLGGDKSRAGRPAGTNRVQPESRRGARPGPGAKPRRGPEPPPGQISVARVRVQYAKRGNARYLSHLDTIRALGRAFRRAQLPMALSGGYNPQPKVAYATALAVGVESESEYVDLEMSRGLAPDELARSLSAALPKGLELRRVQVVRLRGPALQSYASVSRYRINPRPGAGGVPSGLADRVAELLASDGLPVTRHGGKELDIRRYVRSLSIEGQELVLELGADGRGAGRVDEILAMLGLDLSEWQVLKTDFWPLAGEHKLSVWEA